ncbi:MAG TPA: hypothetical protein VFY03_08390 [Woeseiaceae bacterium]|nr:hypothetical protein [Woeseiaceae bacterium]
MSSIETWELLSYVVTVLGLPIAIAVFAYEKRRENAAEEAEVYEALSANYHDFLRLALENADLKLLTAARTENLNPEQVERMLAIFGLLIALFERAYLLLYEPDLTGKEARRWRSWEDFMQEWCEREDFREAMPRLLQGEDPAFSAHLLRLAADRQSHAAGSGRDY